MFMANAINMSRKCTGNLTEMSMKNLKCLAFIIMAAFYCQSRDHAETFSMDSIAMMGAAVADSVLNTDYLNSYRKKTIPISVKPMSELKPYKQDFYHTDYSEGNYTLKDTLYIFGEIRDYTPSSSRVNLNIPSEGVWAHYFLIRKKNKWTIVKDSTNMYET
jgi:hypothetical protein